MVMRINRTYGLLLALLSVLLLSGCGLPRVVVLEDPLTPEEHLNLGVAYERQGELEGAIKEYGLAARKLPLGYLYLGNVYFQRGDLVEAERHYRKAMKKDPGNADARNNLAWLYYTKGERLEEAESLALEAIGLDPSKEEVYRDTLDKVRQLRGSKGD
jgi:tetratricopeptide (TPR) repeat protein